MDRLYSTDGLAPPHGRWVAVNRLAVLYEDDDLLAVDKPAGLVVHPAYRHPDGTLFDAVLARQTARGEERPCLLHRLDRDTSGVVLFAKTAPARRALVRQFERRQVRKWYLALIAGRPAADAGLIAQPLRRDPLDRRRVVVDPDGQPAETRYRVLAADDARALLLVEPRTGRTHQIRAHLAWLGHPLLGDATYALPTSASPSSGGIEQSSADTGLPLQVNGGALYTSAPSELTANAPAAYPARHLLHAWALGVCHPATGAALRLVAPLPPDFAARLPDGWRVCCADALAAWDNAPVVSDASKLCLDAPPSIPSRLTVEPPTAPPNEEATHASCQH